MNVDARRDLLLHGSVQIEGRVAESSNQALLVRVESGGDVALAIYKAEAGERPLWDFPDGLWRREIAAYELSRELELDLVPLTVGRDDLPFGPGSLQWWVDDNGEDHYFTLRERTEFSPWFAELAAFDVVANNADRKSGHVLFDGERCWAIDNGLCFHEEDKLRTVIWEYAGLEISSDVIDRLERFASSDGGALREWLSPTDVAHTLARAQHLATASEYPLPDEDGEWPPYPWPLV
jgi:uncharacterized repeat protein (TIGR03843 family)